MVGVNVERVLFATDGSPGAEAAIPHALTFARRHGATLHAVYVVDTSLSTGGTVRDALEQEGERALASTQQAAEKAGVPVETRSRAGSPAEELLAAADEADADLVVLGSHGRQALDRILLGSVADRVIRGASVPVLTVGGPDGAPVDPPYDTVLCPVDGSDGADAALDWGADVASATGATLHVLHVVDVSSVGPDVRSKAVVADLVEEGETLVDDAASRARDAGVADVVTAVEKGAPARTIVDYADDEGVDFVAMGTHGRTGLSRLVIGSVAERVVRWLAAPVLTVRG